jgi:hypothetical protein
MGFPGNTVKDTDKGFKALQKRMRDLQKGDDWEITVGVHDAAGIHKGTSQSVADIALIHEFGAPAANIPARSFIGAWFDQHSTELFKKTTPDLAKYIKGTFSKLQVLARAGSRAVAGIQSRMAQNIPPPLKQATIDRKGSSVALIDTGQLRTSVTWAVKK